MRESTRIGLGQIDEGPLTDSRAKSASGLLSLNPNAVLRLRKDSFRVNSQAGGGFYQVDRVRKGWTCQCADFRERGRPCKHIYAVIITLDSASGTPREVSAASPAVPISRNWPAYDEAQQAEEPEFDSLLWCLLSEIPEPVRTPGKRGRPPIPLRLQYYHSIRKVQLQKPCRRARGLIQLINDGTGALPEIPNYAVPSRLFNDENAVPQFQRLLALSSLPLRELEWEEPVATDSTGFTLTIHGVYNSQTHDPGRRREFIKLHTMVGVRTGLALVVRITDERGADCPQLIPMLMELLGRGYKPETLTGDGAYASRLNYQTARDNDVDAYFAFHRNATGKSGGSREWASKCHLFLAHRPEFEKKYHSRSLAESFHSSIKRKLGEALYSKNPVAQVSELYAKLVCYNLSVLIHEAHEQRIDLGRSEFRHLFAASLGHRTEEN